jgi:hypothetical protein
MATSKARAERRKPLQVNLATGGGYGDGNQRSKPASGNLPAVNPFMLPKASGLNIISQLYPDNYYVEWDLTTWRVACDQAQKMGFPVSYATLVNWCFEASTFVQSLFNAVGDGIQKVPCYLVDEAGNKNEMWTDEICNKKWFKDLRKEITWADMWGFTGLNIDPLNNKIYKYSMSQIDPINRMLRESTYNFSDGMDFGKTINLLFVQPSTSYERFLGKMQPITREFIMMNKNSLNWIQAGARLAFPLLKVGYPSTNNSLTDVGNLINPFRSVAEDYISNLDPSKALISPYVVNQNGDKVTALDLETKDPGGRANAHKIYQEFNSDQKNDIRELVFGGTLTSNAGKFGTKGLGQVHENKLKTALEARNEEILTVLNDDTDFLWKLRKFYKNFPENLHFDTNRTKEFDINEVKELSDSITENGLRLTKNFYVKYGMDEEDIEEAPEPAKPSSGSEDPDVDPASFAVVYDKGKRSFFGSSKKKLYA